MQSQIKQKFRGEYMVALNEVEKSLLLDCREMFLYEDGNYIIDFSNYELKEQDEIKKVQELVFYLEKLEELGYIKTEDVFYKESDKMSFEYMNSATEIYFDKLSITELGVQWIVENGLGFNEKLQRYITKIVNSFFSSRKWILFSYILIFILGLIAGMILS